MELDLSQCNICPHNCLINRTNGQIGRCKSTNKIKIALASIHRFEEPCISGTQGSGTVFFSNCNLSCVYCQNYKISQEGKGYEVTDEELSSIFLDLQKKGAHNINLVTPTMYVPQIINAITIAKKRGLTLPIIYNSNGYENVETIKALKGYIDIYLPDLKYFDNNLAKKYSKINNYFENASKSIQEMYFQVGLPKFNKGGIIEKGLIIRHLVLPNNLENSKNVLMWIKNNMPKKVYISLMMQYFPTNKAADYIELNRKISSDENKEIRSFFDSLGFENGYYQDLGENEEEYVPVF